MATPLVEVTTYGHQVDEEAAQDQQDPAEVRGQDLQDDEHQDYGDRENERPGLEVSYARRYRHQHGAIDESH